ncbi:DUF262 domain-containing protein [Mucilaginibacter gotjawali]|uniref:GmrSD restriction endonucleases N-terminal domain-containing protein n=2 Tax=Mucilaginibacter gotjawali TaxID=1550579 RepID=A0A0X8X8Z1_9SPHI|nr:DUF262 domain-containing protein [Mucilaginibacter gotjawali]MBB3058297.1 hypothetical protein [Mucilaginibacter gotjawali]BAU55584.1 hypothetical protein MgSA37_03774 [Mucilaginibacter gotjawali]
MDRVDYQSLVIQDIINLANKGELNLTPWYQRRSVWNKPQQSYLVNTLFEKKPLPSIYIRHSLDLQKGISIKEVVDGQQRTNAIIAYCNNEYSARHPNHKKLIKFSELTKTEKQDLLLTSIPVGYLLGATDSDVIDIFARINSVSKTLNVQEKRNAVYSGEFKQFCVKESVLRTDLWKEYKIFSGNDVARMNEVQFISDLIINLIEGLTDFSQPKIDKYYKDNDENFAEMENVDKRLTNIFDTIVSLNPDAIKQTIFSRQPIFFSLIIAIDKLPKISISKIEKGIMEIDNRYNSDKPLTERTKEDANFYNACSASTQRLNNRTIRDNYIYNYIS